MNVLFLTTHLNAGGITSYLLTLTKGFIARGHKVHIASSGGNMENEFVLLGARIVTLNMKAKSELAPKIYFSLLPLKKYIQENRIDVVHAHTRITQVMAKFLKSLTGVPFVTTCHGFFKPRFFRRIFPCWGDVAIAISSAVQVHLEKDFHVKSSQIALVESGIDLNKFAIMDEKKRAQKCQGLGIHDEPVIGIIARLSDVKGQDILVKAFGIVIKQFPQAKLLLVGEGKLELLLKTLVQQLDLKDSVIFRPVINETKEYLDCLDIFVMPSRNEGLGISIMEAQACGLPVVASRVGGIPSLIEDGKTGLLVEPENVEDLALKLIELLKNPQQSKEMGLRAKKFAQNNYSSEKMVDKTLDAYQKVLKND